MSSFMNHLIDIRLALSFLEMISSLYSLNLTFLLDCYCRKCRIWPIYYKGLNSMLGIVLARLVAKSEDSFYPCAIQFYNFYVASTLSYLTDSLVSRNRYCSLFTNNYP